MRKGFLLFVHGVLLLTFILLYSLIEYSSPGTHFGENFNPVYFGVITHATVGYGDLSPETSLARTVVVVHVTLATLSTMLFAA